MFRILKTMGTAVTGFFLFVFVFIIFPQQWRDWSTTSSEAKLEHLNEVADEFVEATRANKIRQTGFSNPPSGKVLLVNMDHSKNFDHLQGSLHEPDFLNLKLPASLKPETADEVEVVAALYWGEQHTGNYSSGSQAYRETCQIKVYDRNTWQLITELNVAGEDPPQRVKEARNVNVKRRYFGSGCEERVIEALEKLLVV